MITWTDIVAVVISLLALILSCCNYYRYKDLTQKSNDMMNIQTLTAQGALETQIRSAIAEATRNVVLLGVELSKDAQNEMLISAYAAAEETYRNAYEDACSKYLDNKVDSQRFEKMYKREILTLVEREPHAEHYARNQSPYTSTLKVYSQWYH